jgi:hypothetical protein
VNDVSLSARQGALRVTVGSIVPDFKREIEVFCEPAVVRLASRQCEPHRQAIGIDHRMNLAEQTRLATVPWTVFYSY